MSRLAVDVMAAADALQHPTMFFQDLAQALS
jgi:hypothetical protein